MVVFSVTIGFVPTKQTNHDVCEDVMSLSVLEGEEKQEDMPDTAIIIKASMFYNLPQATTKYSSHSNPVPNNTFNRMLKA